MADRSDKRDKAFRCLDCRVGVLLQCWVTTAHPVQRLGTDHMAARAGFHWDLHHHEHSGDISRQDPAIYFFQKAVGAHVQRNGSNVAPNFVS